MLEDTSTLVLGERLVIGHQDHMLGERLEGDVRRHQHHSIRREARGLLENTRTIVLGERLEGYVRGHQHPSARRKARGLC